MIGIISIFFLVFLSIVGMKKRNYVSIMILIVMVVFQNFLLIIVSPYIDKNIFTLIIFIKELYVFGVFLLSLCTFRKFSRYEIGCIACIIVILVYALLYSSKSLQGALVSIRQLYLPFMFFIIGNSLKCSKFELNKLLIFYLKIMILVSVGGYIEMTIGDSLWEALGYSSYAVLKGIESGISKGFIVSGAFYSYDLGFRVRRMASFLAEPVIVGQLLSVAFIICLFYKDIFKNNIQRIVYTIIIASALLLTLAKGGIIIAALAVIMLLGDIYGYKRLSYMMLISFSLVFITYSLHSIDKGYSGQTHLAGLSDNVINLFQYPWGRGIGSIGNLGYNYGGRGELLASGESFIGAAIGQMGIFAIIIYSYFYFNLFTYIRRVLIKKKYVYGKIILWLNVGLLLTSFINNTAISFSSCFIYYILAGIRLNESGSF